MKKKHILLILWGFCIALYIANIIIVCVTGGSLFNNIIAWTVAIIFAGLIMFYINLTAGLIEQNEFLHKFIRNLFESKESKEIEKPIQQKSSSYGTLITDESLKNTVKELWDFTESDTKDNEGAVVDKEILEVVTNPPEIEITGVVNEDASK